MGYRVCLLVFVKAETMEGETQGLSRVCAMLVDSHAACQADLLEAQLV
jgi:hypothetical protein